MRKFLTFSLLVLFYLMPCLAQDATKEYNLLMQMKGQETTSICVT